MRLADQQRRPPVFLKKYFLKIKLAKLRLFVPFFLGGGGGGGGTSRKKKVCNAQRSESGVIITRYSTLLTRLFRFVRNLIRLV